MCEDLHVIQPETRIQFFTPLPRQRVRRDDGDASVRRIELDLTEDDSGFDRFAESHLVRQQVTDDWVVQNAVRDFGLMLEHFDLRRQQRGQSVCELVLAQQFAQ